MTLVPVEQRQTSLARLASEVNREHAAALDAATTALEHAIRCGELLLEIRGQTQSGWTRWLEDNFDGSVTTAQAYVRLAREKDQLLQAGITTLDAARELLAGPPRPNGNWYSDDLRDEARRLSAQGLRNTRIAAELGVAHKTVRRWLDPKVVAADRERSRQAWAALRRQSRDQEIKRVVRKLGGAPAEAYAMAERMQDVLAQAHRETEDPDQRRHLALAGEYYRKARDEIVRALGCGT